MILCGASRKVFLVGGWAIKIANWDDYKSFLHGILSNYQEYHFSNIGNPKLAKVLFRLPLYLVIIMERAAKLEKFISREDFDEFIKEEDYLLPVEFKQDSFGIIDGRLVAIDYGVGANWSDFPLYELPDVL